VNSKTLGTDKGYGVARASLDGYKLAEECFSMEVSECCDRMQVIAVRDRIVIASRENPKPGMARHSLVH
jgi:hypothetical protein